MKKIINGKVYDTTVAVKIAEWCNNRWDDNLYYCTEDLYRKRTGEFFLHGEGGPMSKYAESRGNNSWCGGAKIIPLSYESAQEWAEEHLSADEYEAIFGEVVEDESRTYITIYISNAAIERAKRAASQKGVSLSGYIENLIQ